MKILVVGAGAVGGTVAARLQRSGAEPAVFDSNEEHVQLLRDPGLIVDGRDDGTPVPLDASTALVSSTPDLILLAVRSMSTVAALGSIGSLVGEHTDVVSLQNGLNEDRISAVVGPDRTIGCTVGFGATWISPGHLTLDATGGLVIGRLDGSTDDRLEAARRALDLAFPTKISDNVIGALWAKMLVNSMTVMGALAGMLTGELLATPQRRGFVADVVAEGVRVAKASGVSLLPIFGAVGPDVVDTDPYQQTMDRVLVAFAERFGAIRSVTLRDFELGRATEIDAVTGEIVRRGNDLGVPTPLNATIYTMLKEIEAGKRAPDVANLDDAAARSSETTR
jgi:2-dehydropantoate 2-reductase